MTKEEALNDWLPIIRQMVKGTEVYVEALDMAIKALEQQPINIVNCVATKEYLDSYNDVPEINVGKIDEEINIPTTDYENDVVGKARKIILEKRQ